MKAPKWALRMECWLTCHYLALPIEIVWEEQELGLVCMASTRCVTCGQTVYCGVRCKEKSEAIEDMVRYAVEGGGEGNIFRRQRFRQWTERMKRKRQDFVARP